MSKIRDGLVFLLAMTIALVVVTPSPAHAAYFFRPGEPTFFGFAGNPVDYCTGGYAVRGTDGLFLLTASHCGAVGTAVYGTDARFGTIAHTKGAADDTALIKETAPNDAYQIVVDPLTGRTPGGSGKVVGVLSSSNFTNGYLVGKMGQTTGWTEGAIFGTSTWYGKTVYCSFAKTDFGDSGGPVWRTAPNGGVYAIGITVSKHLATGGGCFYAVSRLLQVWGATLPTFPSGFGSAKVIEPTEFPSTPLPTIPPSELEAV